MTENLFVTPDGLANGNTHAFIVLGFVLNDDGTMKEELVNRLKVALNNARKYPNNFSYFRMSSFSTNDKKVAEAVPAESKCLK